MGVVQDVADGRVLMVGWLDVEALAATLGTGDVHFHSRSRGRLWRKGETSGNVLRLRSLALDCDGDALLIGAEPLGPTCHRETRSCFDPDALSRAVPGCGADPRRGPTRWSCRGERRCRASPGSSRCGRRSRTGPQRPPGSYTVALLDGGVDKAGRKVTEEATEVLLAAKNDEPAEAAGGDRTETRALLAGEAATSSTTRWCCSRSAASSRGRSSTRSGPARTRGPG